MSKENNAVYHKLINSTKWRKARAAAMMAAQYLCADCMAVDGRATAAEEVHHIIPVETAHTEQRMAALMFDPSNMVALCHRCHVARHREMRSHSTEARKKREEQTLEARCNELFTPRGQPGG